VEVDGSNQPTQVLNLALDDLLCPGGSIHTAADHADGRSLDRDGLLGIEISYTDQDDLGFGHGLEPGDRFGQRTPAPARKHRQRHSVQEAAGRDLRGVEVAVRVEPDDADAGPSEPGNRTDRRAAIPGEDERKPAGFLRGADVMADQPRELLSKLG
jgi:hypothetical protein